MIRPKIDQTSAAVALHYNELDPFYREIWGDHVHHGYWQTGKETSTEAADALAELVAERLDLKPGMSVCDIGCGYGETARLFSSRYGVFLEGVTISESQFRVATARRAPGVSIRLCDWLQNGFPDRHFDSACAIESSEHIGDKQRFFSEAFRVLRPGGRLVVCAWLAKAGASVLSGGFSWSRSAVTAACPGWERRRIIKRWRRAPVSTCSPPTTSAPMCGAPGLSASKGRPPSYSATGATGEFLFGRGAQNKVFALTLFLMLAAYGAGAMRYCVFTFEKPRS